MLYPNGDRYYGELSGKLRHGFGRFTSKDITGKEGHYRLYEGTWNNNMRDGALGVCLYWNGDAYVGGWLNDNKHGKGRMITMKGDKIEGRWERD